MANAVDKEQIEMLRNWWNDYGKSILIAIIIGLVVGFGWRYWKRYETTEAQNASALYSQMQSALLAKDQGVLDKLNTMMQEKFSNTAYAEMGSLITAKLAVDNNKLDQAVKNLDWVAQHGSKDEFKELARINKARVLLAQKQPQQALDLLKTSDYAGFAPIANRVEGDIYFAMGHKALAKQAYKKAEAGLNDMHLQDPYLSLLVNQTQ